MLFSWCDDEKSSNDESVYFLIICNINDNVSRYNVSHYQWKYENIYTIYMYILIHYISIRNNFNHIWMTILFFNVLNFKRKNAIIFNSLLYYRSDESKIIFLYEIYDLRDQCVKIDILK